MAEPFEITINIDVKCKDCGKKGATECGYCLRCVAKQIKRKPMYECPHCGRQFTRLENGRIPMHDFPRRRACPGEDHSPRDLGPDKQPLWKEYPLFE